MKRQPTAMLEDQPQPPSDTPYVMDASGQALRAHFHRVRALGGAVAIAAVIATIMLVLHGDGVTIESFIEADKKDTEVKKLVDDYNSISGSIGSFIAKPIEFFLGVLVSAAFLCFATDLTIDKGSIGHWQYIPLLTGAAIAYLFGNGLNALNVQVVSGKINIRMGHFDLRTPIEVDNQPIFLENGSIPTTWDRAYLENASDNRIVNTIMHTKIMPIENSNAECNGTGDRDVTEPFLSMPVISFGFPSRAWQPEVLLEAATPISTLKITMNKSVSDLPNESALPSSVAISRGLVNTGYRILSDLYLSTNQTDPPAVPSSASFMSAAHSTWLAMFNNTKGAYVKDATVEYSRYQLTHKVTYDAMTVEVPVAMIQRNKFGFVVNPVNGSNEMLVEDYCSREGCLIPPAENSLHNKTTTVQSRVQVASICLNEDGSEDDQVSSTCSRPSTTSMRVVSIGSRIEGDVWDMVNKTDGNVARFKGLRTVYSITIGRIAWEIEDLGKIFDAECDNDEDEGRCNGLRYKLQPTIQDHESDYLVVGTDHLPIKALNAYTAKGADKWVYIVSSGDGLGEQRYEVLRPRNFVSVTENGGNLRAIAADKCNTYSDDYIRAVERNHLFMEHSLQASYTAGLFYLFENAVKVVRQLQDVSKTSSNGKSSTTTKTYGEKSVLKFGANQQVMDVVVSVPTKNALVSLGGCLVILIVSVGIVMLAKKSEQRLEERANVEIVTEAMLNSSKYPPWLLNLALEQAAAAYTQEQQEHGQPPQEERVRVMLQDLRVQSVNLHHNKIADHAFVIGSDTDKS